MPYPSSSQSPSSLSVPTLKKPRSTLVSRNITIAGHRTSVRLEPEMWTGLSDICRREHGSLNEICTVVAGVRPPNSSLTAAIRVFVMAYFRAAATEDGHNRVGHGRGAVMLNQPMPAALIPGSNLATPAGHNPNLMGYPTVTASGQPNAPSTAMTRPQQVTGRPMPYIMGGNGRR